MSEYGIRIRNYEAGSIYGCSIGVRKKYDYTRAMLTNSLFKDYLVEIGLDIWNGESTRDVICIEFNYGTKSYEDEINHLDKMIRDLKAESEKKGINNTEKISKIAEIRDAADSIKDRFVKKSADQIRNIYYTEGVNIEYVTRDKNGEVKKQEIVHYKMLYRTPGKAKKGSAIFICDRLYDKAKEFLTMGIRLPYENAPLVEMAAYSSLITSSIVGKVHIDPSEILVIKDVDSFFETNIISVGTDINKQCIASKIDKYRLKNTMFDGQALIDVSICPEWSEGYLLLRHHMNKMAAFVTYLQKFFMDYFGDAYDTATVTDYWGNEHLAKDIKLVTTENAMKWMKFGVSYEYWSEWVRKNGCMFGIVKTAHKSKLGEVQRMSYQMVNALDETIMDSVCHLSMDYINRLKINDEVFLDYLKDNMNFSNDFDVLIALVKQDPEFVRSDYFRDRRKKIIHSYVLNFKNGRALQNADNLVIVGSPYAMLLHTVGADVEEDDTFKQEDGTIQCYTERFADDEYLACFRSPFNSKNNMGYLHNVYDGRFKKYFKFGKQIIAVNMKHTDFQDRSNGLTYRASSAVMRF